MSASFRKMSIAAEAKKMGPERFNALMARLTPTGQKAVLRAIAREDAVSKANPALGMG